MTTKIIKIGNSLGIRLPKSILEESGLSDKVELEVKNGKIVISSSLPRDGWDDAFKTMAQQGDDKLLDKNNLYQSSWDEEEWEW